MFEYTFSPVAGTDGATYTTVKGYSTGLCPTQTAGSNLCNVLCCCFPFKGVNRAKNDVLHGIVTKHVSGDVVTTEPGADGSDQVVSAEP